MSGVTVQVWQVGARALPVTFAVPRRWQVRSHEPRPAEELLARFAVLGAAESIDGRDPLTGLA